MERMRERLRPDDMPSSATGCYKDDLRKATATPMADVTHKIAISGGGAGSCAQISALALALGSIGVGYGDIGTSRRYAFHVAVEAAVGSGPITRDVVLGVLSLILWALTIVDTVKYVLILLRADNNGEGGTLALTALA